MNKKLMLALLSSSLVSAQSVVSTPATAPGPSVAVTADLSGLARVCQSWKAVLGQVGERQVGIAAETGDKALGLSVPAGSRVTFALLCTTPGGTARAVWLGEAARPVHLRFQSPGTGGWTALAGDAPLILVR